MQSRADAVRLDEADPIRALRDAFVIGDPDMFYLNGNSLGRLPEATVHRLTATIEQEWGHGLVRSWQEWIDLPQRVGDRLGEALLGAAAGQVVIADSTSVNLYKLAVAALDARPGRHRIVTDDDNFPTDRYVLEGIAAARGAELCLIHADPDTGVDPEDVRAAVDESTALVSLSHVSYRSGALLDLAEITEIAHQSGALMLWDLCHSVGAIPVELDAAEVDLAVGCTYKYLNAGPGAPAFLYVRRDLQTQLRQPIWGWFGQREQFAMGPAYDPRDDIGRFLSGSPSILGLVAVEEGVRLLESVGIDAIRAKSMQLTEALIDLADCWLTEVGFTVASPRAAERRGGHVTLRHPHAATLVEKLAAAGVIVDHREPQRLRLAPAAPYTRFVDVWDAIDVMRQTAGD